MNIIVANWKMNPNSLKEAEDLFDSIVDGVSDNVVICSPFMYLQELSERNQGSVKLGAQDMFWKDQGAYTGEVSPAMLKDAKCQYVILGHSERRKNLLETDEMVNKKVGVAIENGLIPIVCIGETEKEREEDKAEEVLEKEIRIGLDGVDLSKVIIAYEPIWAISTNNSGNACDPEEANNMREIILKMTNKKMNIIYGGSVNADNAKSYLEVGFNGLLVGAKSLDAKEFLKIANV